MEIPCLCAVSLQAVSCLFEICQGSSECAISLQDLGNQDLYNSQCFVALSKVCSFCISLNLCCTNNFQNLLISLCAIFFCFCCLQYILPLSHFTNPLSSLCSQAVSTVCLWCHVKVPYLFPFPLILGRCSYVHSMLFSSSLCRTTFLLF